MLRAPLILFLFIGKSVFSFSCKSAFTIPAVGIRSKSQSSLHLSSSIDNTSEHNKDEKITENQTMRRTFLSNIIKTTTASTITIFSAAAQPQPSLAVMMKNDSKEATVFTPGEAIGKDLALERFQLARDDLKYLLANYDSISQGGGDNIRRYLGTVGVSSGMYGITKVLKVLQKESDDIVEFTESMNEFNSYLNLADSACYSANFVEFSSAKTKPEQFFQQAKDNANSMLTYMDKMGKEIGL